MASTIIIPRIKERISFFGAQSEELEWPPEHIIAGSDPLDERHVISFTVIEVQLVKSDIDATEYFIAL